MKDLSRTVIIFALVIAAIAGFTTSLFLHAKNPSVVSIEKTRTFHYPMKLINQLKNDPQAPQKIYQEYCAACHAAEPLIDIKAPRVGFKKEWEPFCKLGTRNLLRLANHGVGAMPARGGCFECDDILIEKTILFMLNKTRIKCQNN